MFNYCNAANAVAFVKKYYSDCVRLARMVDVPPEYLLALAATETEWGNPSTFAGINNYFSMETANDKPNLKYAEGYQIAAGTVHDKHPVKLGIYPSFYVCGLSFIDRYGTAIRGSSTPQQFVDALIRSGFNTADAKTNGNPKFPVEVPNAITAVTARLLCPG